MEKKIRILIVDDHPVVRNGLIGMLSGRPEFEIAGEASDGQQAVDQSARLRPQVILMDLRMPVMDGVEAITRIRARQPEVHVLVLTTYDTDADILRAIEAGATGYILKDAPREDLYRAILEGLAYALLQGKEKIEKRSGTKITRLRVSGGGSHGPKPP